MTMKSFLQSCRFRSVVALLLLVGLYWHVDWKQMTTAVAELDLFYLSMASLLFAPQILVSALRWQRFVTPLCRISLAEALRQTLASSAWNLVTPSKLGDFSKAAMLPLDDQTPRSKGAAVVAYEKLSDVAALCALWLSGYIGLLTETYTALVCVAMLGLVFSLFPSSWCYSAAPGYGRWQSMIGTSLVLWCLHVLQIDLFLRAADVYVSWNVAMSRIPAAIFAGLVPITFCGVGTRDSALVWLFADVAEAPAMAVVGLLSASRYLVPGALGIPIASSFRRLTAANQQTPLIDFPSERELPSLPASGNLAA
jgi:hypothetical protein